MTIEKPDPIENPDLSQLKKLASSYVEFVDSEDYHEDNDFNHYIFEEVMNTLYGPDFWKWHRQRQ